MNKKTFEWIAIATLVFPALGAYYAGRPFAAWLSSLDDEVSALSTLLGYVLALLGCVLVWAVALLPLRRLAGMPSIVGELKEGKLIEGYHRERAAIRERETSSDPALRARQHFQFTLIGAVMSAVSLLLTWVLWQDGFVVRFILVPALALPPITLYHLAQGLRYRRRIAG